jgi:GT2 family glycosyltransferase
MGGFMTSTDVIITTHRNTAKLKNCLTGLLEHTKFADYKVYLFANDPNDEVKQIVEDAQFLNGVLYNDRIEAIYNDDNSGSFASNNNLAAKEGNGEYLLFLNDDTYPLRDDWLQKMTAVLDNNEKISIVGALLLYPDQKTIQHCGVFFSAKTNNLPYHLHYRQPLTAHQKFVSQYRYFQAITGAALLIRRKDFEAVGGFNEAFYYMYEDIGLCLDVKTQLKKYCLFCPEALLVHDEGISKDGSKNSKFQQNISTFKQLYVGKYFDDLGFYLNDERHLVYRR